MRRHLLLFLLLLFCLTAGCGKPEEPSSLDTGRVRGDTEYLCNEIGPRVTGTQGERAACDWLESRLAQAGFSAASGTLLRTPFRGLKGQESENLMAVCNPDREGPILCVVAHYDSVEGCPGARDNAASVAVALELARYLGPERRSLAAQVRVLFPGAEENGYYGSNAYVISLTAEERARHLAAFNMDISAASPGAEARLVCLTLGGLCGGEYQEGNFLEPVDNLPARTIREVSGEDVPLLHCGESDHISFHQAGIEAVNVCWRAVDGPIPVLPEEYHRPDDTPDTLDFETAAATGKCILAALERLAEEGTG